MRQTFRILFYIKKNEPKKNGMTSIMIRLTIAGEKVQFNSQLETDPKLWDAKSGRLSGRSKYAQDINSMIDRIRAKLAGDYEELMLKNSFVTPEKLRDKFFGLEDKKTTLIYLFDKKIKEKKALVGNTIDKSTLYKYELTKRKLLGFLDYHYQTTDLPIKEVDYDFVSN